jgi:hypothetical protein
LVCCRAMHATAIKRGTPAVPNHFLDPRSCHELLGNLRYGNIGSLPVSLLYFQLHYFLRDAHKNYAPEVGTIPRRLREHNLKVGAALIRALANSIETARVCGLGSLNKRIRRHSQSTARPTSTHSVCPDSMSLPQLNPVEPPWYGPVCPVVGEGWHREVSPYPDRHSAAFARQTALRLPDR